MATTDIPREEWSDFFDELGLQYEGWRATVENIEGVGEDEEEIETRECTIESMNAELEDGEDMIALTFVNEVPLTIGKPIRVSMQDSEEGRDNLLEIESDTGLVRVWLRFPADMAAGDEEDEVTDEW